MKDSMPSPKLPPMTPPAIPTRRTANAPEPKKGSNFITIVLITMLLVWTFQFLTKKPEPPKTPENAPTAESEAVTVPPTAEESKAIVGALS